MITIEPFELEISDESVNRSTATGLRKLVEDSVCKWLTMAENNNFKWTLQPETTFALTSEDAERLN